MKQLIFHTIIVISLLTIVSANAQIGYGIDSITVKPQFTNQENILIRIDGQIGSPTYGAGDSTINIVGDSIFIFIEFKNGFGTGNYRWTVYYNLPPMSNGNYVIKCTAQILVPLHNPVSAIDSFKVISPSGIEEANSNSENLILQNYPNPATDFTEVKIKIEKQDYYDFIIYDASARIIKTIKDVCFEKGDYSLNIDTRDLKNGVYFYTLKGNYRFPTREIIIKR